MSNEIAGFGDNAVVTVQRNQKPEDMFGIGGRYEVVCRDANGNVKWEDVAENLVVAAGKQLMLDTLLRGSAYTVVGPFLGLTKVSLTPVATDTMTTLVTTNAGEFVNYTVGGSAVRGTAAFGVSSSSGTTPANVTTSTATGIVYTITGAGGTVYGCFLVTGTGAVSTQSNTSGTLYSEGNFSGGSKVVVSGDTLTVTYSTTATS
jgi:hypothetical protein